MEAAEVDFPGLPEPAELRALATNPSLRALSISGKAVFSLRHAQAIASVPALERLRIWCPATRAAIAAVLQTPELEALHLLELHAGGTLRGFETARTLKALLVAAYGLRPDDLIAISRSPSLQTFFAMDATVTPQALAALAGMPELERLSLEDSRIDDAKVAVLLPDVRLQSLFLAGNPLTDTGLRTIVRLRALRELDLWQTPVTLAGIATLDALPELEYLSLGHADPAATFDPDALLPLLARLPKLQRLELDGIVLNARQHAAYAERFALKLVER